MQNNFWHSSHKTQRSIDQSGDVFEEYPVCAISVAVLEAVMFNDAYLFKSLLCLTIEGVYFYF